jgi:type II secretory ATPase GspE/PulE/Tfp pilus assembly ATPase PilB-like protein
MAYGIGRVPADVDPASEALAELDAMKQTPRRQTELRRELRCPRCRQTGYSGEYPFSTCPPLCDDCN